MVVQHKSECAERGGRLYMPWGRCVNVQSSLARVRGNSLVIGQEVKRLCAPPSLGSQRCACVGPKDQRSTTSFPYPAQLQSWIYSVFIQLTSCPLFVFLSFFLHTWRQPVGWPRNHTHQPFTISKTIRAKNLVHFVFVEKLWFSHSDLPRCLPH